MAGKGFVALVALLVCLMLGLGASASANVDVSHTIATAGDCNANGIPDTSEASWANRDDDGDGFCNGVDFCPYEATATNDDASACQTQAITVPFDPSDPSKPHPTYSGAIITLKGIARYGGDQFSWDYGDGSPPMSWTAIADPYNLGVQHAYVGSVGQTFDATLSVRNSANPDVVASATYPVEIEQASDLTDPAQIDVRAQMASDAGLWYLHLTESRSRYADGVPGEEQNYGYWAESMRATCAAIDAFETQGSTPGSGWRDDPYVEDAQRGLAYVLYNSPSSAIAPQQYGNPDTNGNGIGVLLGGTDDTYTNSLCAMALADSNAPGRLASTGASGIYGRSYADITQDAVDWFAYGQVDGNSYDRGSWGYGSNAISSNAETFRWPVFAMESAEREEGSTVPPFVRQNIPFFLNFSHYTAPDNLNGGWGWENATDFTTAGFTAAGIAIHTFLGDSPQHSDVLHALGFLYRHWNDPVNDVWGNLGDSDAMYTVARAMQGLAPGGLTEITDLDYTTGQQTSNSFDWYDSPATSQRQGYAAYLVPHQAGDGSWQSPISGAHSSGPVWSTAFDVMTLGMVPQTAPAPQTTLPTANPGGPYTVAPGGSVTLDATGSSDPSGGALAYAWDLLGNGLYADSTSATPTFTAANVPAGTVYPVCVRVTSAGGSATACTTVTVTVVAAPPVAQVTPLVTVSGPLPVDVTLDGSRSYGTSGDLLTYAWTVDDSDGETANATSAIATHTFHHYGTYTAHLIVSDGALASAADETVQIVDKTSPTLTVPADLTLPDGPSASAQVNAWLASASATDDDPDHPQPTITNDFAGIQTGTQTVTWTATDAAGNTTQKSAKLTIQSDTTPPVVTPTIDGTLGDNGWYTSDVHVTWQVSDPESSFTSTGCGDADVTSDTDAAGTALTCSATSAGGTTTVPLTIKRDTTPPTIQAAPDRAANADGWYDSDVTVTYTCSDAVSGIASCDTPTVLHEGANQTATGTATDNAGNQASASVTGLNVDETAPSLSGSPTTQPNMNGWYRGDVTIHWTCSDAGGSGISGDCPADSTVGGEGRGLSVSQSVADRAGNVTPAASPAVSIDRTPPVTTASAPSGWSNGGVTVTLSATDNLSGVAATFYSLDGAPAAVGTSVPIDSEGRHTLTYWSVDEADNAEATQSVQVLIDKSAPTITHTLSPLPNAAGWNNGDVTVKFFCDDSLSGIAFCSPLQVLAGEGRALTADGTATDNAGNSATDSATVAIDRTRPTIKGAPDRAPNANGWYDADVVVSFTCDDTLSGIATCPAATTLKEGADQSAVGTAKDVADNSATANVSGIDVDETAPVIAYTGNAGSYTVDQNVAIHCAATDALSGVASSTCADLTGPAWTFGLGTVSASATATDLAGNAGTGSTSFTVGVTCAGVRSLIATWVTDPSVASGLTAKLDAICTAPNANAKSGKLGAFDNQVAAQTGKSIAKDKADLLTQYAAQL